MGDAQLRDLAFLASVLVGQEALRNNGLECRVREEVGS